MSAKALGNDEQSDDPGQWALRVLAVAAACLGVAALAAATFVLSYSAIRAVVLQAGIAPRLARGYPLLLDVMLTIVLAAILALHDAGLASRLLAWVTLLLVMAAAAGADAMHTAGRVLPHQAAAITAAVLPFVLVLVAFVLLLTMLRHARLRQPANGNATAGRRTRRKRAIFAPSQHDSPLQDDPHLQEASDAGPVTDYPVGTAGGVGEPPNGTTTYHDDDLDAGWYDAADISAANGSDQRHYMDPALTAPDDEADPAQDDEEADPELDDEDGPVFHRLFSAPVALPEGVAAEDGLADDGLTDDGSADDGLSDDPSAEDRSADIVAPGP